MKISFCFEAIEFQRHFVRRPSEVRKLVRTNQFQVESTKIGTVRKFVTLQYPKSKHCYDQTQRSEFTLALNLDILDAGQSPNAVNVHAGTSQVDFEVDRPPPAVCTPGDLLITMVKETVIWYKKRASKMKKVVSLIDLKVMKTRNDCKIAGDCVKRANVAFHVGLCKEIFARKHTAAHNPTSAQPLIVTTMKPDKIARSGEAPQAS